MAKVVKSYAQNSECAVNGPPFGLGVTKCSKIWPRNPSQNVLKRNVLHVASALYASIEAPWARCFTAAKTLHVSVRSSGLSPPWQCARTGEIVFPTGWCVSIAGIKLLQLSNEPRGRAANPGLHRLAQPIEAAPDFKVGPVDENLEVTARVQDVPHIGHLVRLAPATTQRRSHEALAVLRIRLVGVHALDNPPASLTILLEEPIG